MTKLAPCPWCKDGGTPYIHHHQQTFFSYAVMCHTCFACGPHVKFNPNSNKKSWEEIIAGPKAEAAERWNLRTEQANGEENAKPGKNKGDDETSSGTLAEVS